MIVEAEYMVKLRTRTVPGFIIYGQDVPARSMREVRRTIAELTFGKPWRWYVWRVTVLHVETMDLAAVYE